jgi:FkbM family methyltransferase
MAAKRRLDWTELLLIVPFVAVTTWLIAAHVVTERHLINDVLAMDGRRELLELAGQYGDQRSTRYAEEWAIRDFFKDRRDGVFLDVGANDYQKENNTYYLETSLGWSGVAVDAQQEFAEGYRAHRPHTKFVAAFISDVSGTTSPLYVPKANTLTASTSQAFAEGEDGATVKREVPTLTLDDLLAQHHIERLDFASIDIELAEPKALAGFSIDRYRPALVCIEAHKEVRQQILDFFQRHDYVVLGKYLRLDTANLYFAPARSLSSPTDHSVEKGDPGSIASFRRTP